MQGFCRADQLVGSSQGSQVSPNQNHQCVITIAEAIGRAINIHVLIAPHVKDTAPPNVVAKLAILRTLIASISASVSVALPLWSPARA